MNIGGVDGFPNFRAEKGLEKQIIFLLANRNRKGHTRKEVESLIQTLRLVVDFR